MLNDTRTQLGQLEHLAFADDFVVEPLAVADAAPLATLVANDLIDLRALAQRVALVTLLPAAGALACLAQ